MHLQGRKAEIQNPTQWNLTRRSAITPSLMSSRSSILPPFALSFPQEKFGGGHLKIYYFDFSLFKRIA
jgi:hypothetical protein